MFQSFAADADNFVAMMHEIDHSLSLKHPFEAPRIPVGFDNRRFTIMSYSDPEKIWWLNLTTGAREYLIKTPMVHDILSIQRLYGANMNHRTGNDTYAFNPAAP